MSLLRLRKLASQLGTSAQRGISGTNTRAFSSSREIFSKDGKQSAKLFTLKNDAGMEVTISDWGGCITHIKVPNKDGEFQDVAVCPDTVEGLQNNSPYLGAMIGRTAGRTENAQFEVDGKTYHITKNNGEHNLHGGNVGFHNAK
jgi:aldose 1-epimerase